ncbi:DUF2867 domain-containing protein [Dysgonomonas sp. Marseille-P4677]|uniref:DUF2867 domain-containing protein n=1 Tax=Dysgonomonas sp. Marseille-P4677 TaxID=2364790 RepID=UPI001912BFAB|nr:DUF2867 domain-containing protein [Dysgonomonas sp. Marseille-P4677]MBK5721455.1 DUF2867 domain-containing protein [Dysgonomonas sp. Marseille-P4677]
MKVKKTKIAENDLIAGYLPANYADSFECVINSEKGISADDIMVAFWTKSPKWVNQLFKLRDWVVSPFGIQSGNNRNSDLFEDAIRNNGSYRFIETVAKSNDETVICADDKHLKMYFSVKTIKTKEKQQKLSVSTVVHFHNFLGKAYFFVIYPFHHFIVPSMIRYSIRKLKKSL